MQDPLAPQISPEMRQRYLERRRTDFKDLSNALTAKDAAVFVKVGHQLKGNASTFGFTDLEEIAKQLEVAGQSQNFETARKYLEQFAEWLEQQARS